MKFDLKAKFSFSSDISKIKNGDKIVINADKGEIKVE